MVGKQRFRSNDWVTDTLYVLFCAGSLWWASVAGDFCVGILTTFTYLMCIVAPLIVCGGFLLGIHMDKRAQTWHHVLWAALAIVMPLAFTQPWNPRVQFVGKLEGLKGKTLAQMQTEMKGYVGGEVTRVEDAPEGMQYAGVTHIASYRWNGTDAHYNADVGEVFLKDGIVVKTNFSPD